MNIGDRVRVINTGLSYTVYDKLFNSLGFKNTSRNDERGFYNAECIVFNKSKHLDNGRNLVAIRHIDGRELLIEDIGVVLVSKAEHKLFKLL